MPNCSKIRPNEPTALNAEDGRQSSNAEDGCSQTPNSTIGLRVERRRHVKWDPGQLE
jgi:hypothetical protein